MAGEISAVDQDKTSSQKYDGEGDAGGSEWPQEGVQTSGSVNSKCNGFGTNFDGDNEVYTSNAEAFSASSRWFP